MNPSDPTPSSLKPRPAGARTRRKHATSHPPDRSGYVTSFDGTQLYYAIEGEGPPLVFCYGLVCSSLHWTYQIDYFRKNYQIIWFDYRGHQNSEVPKDFASLTVDSLAQDVNAIVTELKLPPAVFLGHSMGVNVVLEYYRRYPEHVRAMILANGTPRRPLETLFANNVLQQSFDVAFSLYKKAPALVRRLWRLQSKNPFAHTFIALTGFNAHLTPRDDIALYVDEMADMDPGILFYLIQNYNHADSTGWLHEINIPTLLIGGDRDLITPIDRQELMHQLIPNSELIRVAHGSHCVQMDLPDLINTKIEKFLGKIKY